MPTATLASVPMSAARMPEVIGAWLGRGASRIKMTYYRLALADFEQAIRLKPDRSEPLLCHAQAAFALRDYLTTIQDCTAALQRNNTDDRAFYLRAQAKLEFGKINDALDDFPLLCSYFLCHPCKHLKPLKEFLF